MSSQHNEILSQNVKGLAFTFKLMSYYESESIRHCCNSKL